MKTLVLVVLISGSGGVLFGAEPVAEPPPVQVSPPPVAPRYVTPYQAPRYAYGWFGARPRESWYRHFGYYRNYTQWKWK